MTKRLIAKNPNAKERLSEFKLKLKYCIKEKENSLVYVHTNFMINPPKEKSCKNNIFSCKPNLQRKNTTRSNACKGRNDRNLKHRSLSGWVGPKPKETQLLKTNPN